MSTAEPTKLTEDEFDERFGGTANESPLHLSEEQLADFHVGHVWTQAEDPNGQDWLLNGIIADSPVWSAGWNVMGYWISLKRWTVDASSSTRGDPEEGSIQAKWGDDLEFDEENEDNAE